jgi:hypothetical protein
MMGYAENVTSMGRTMNAYNILVGKSKLFGRRQRIWTWEDIVTMDLKEMEYVGVE